MANLCSSRWKFVFVLNRKFCKQTGSSRISKVKLATEYLVDYCVSNRFSSHFPRADSLLPIVSNSICGENLRASTTFLNIKGTECHICIENRRWLPDLRQN